MQMTPAKSQQAMTSEGKIRDKSQRGDKHSRSLEGKRFLPLRSMQFAHLHFWKLFTLRSIYKEKKKISWNLQSAYFWKSPSKIAWLSTHHQWTSAVLDPCLLGVEGEVRDGLDQTWDHSGVTGGTRRAFIGRLTWWATVWSSLLQTIHLFMHVNSRYIYIHIQLLSIESIYNNLGAPPIYCVSVSILSHMLFHLPFPFLWHEPT